MVDKKIYLIFALSLFLIITVTFVLASGSTITGTHVGGNVSSNNSTKITSTMCLLSAKTSLTTCTKNNLKNEKSCLKTAGKNKSLIKLCKSNYSTVNSACNNMFKSKANVCKTYPKK